MPESSVHSGKNGGRIRPPIAVIVSRFPLITETFILREIIELERRGQPVVLVSMIREHPEVVHQEAGQWIPRLMHAPFFSARVALAFARAWLRSPGTMGSLLAWILLSSISSPRLLAKSLLLFPQATFFAEQLAQQGIHHLHAHFATHPATIAHVVSRLTGISYSFTVHAHDIFVDRRLLREKVAAAAFIRAISRFNRAFLENLYPREAAAKIEVVHVGIEPGDYAVRPAVRPEGHALRILCIAAMKPYKGLSFLIEACRLLVAEGAAFTLDIIGSGPLKPRIEEQISAAHLTDHVHLLGPMPQDKVASALHACDVFVLPSVVASDGQMEGIPVALMEAMAACKPVIASSISGIPELVDDHTSGLLVDPANPRRLAEAIRTLLADPELRERLGHAAREKVLEQFTLEGTVESLLGVLDRHRPFAGESALRLTGEVLAASASYGIVRSHAGPDSVVHELIESRGRECRRVIVKRHLTRPGESRPAEMRSAEEYELLVRLHTWLGRDEPAAAPSVRVPQPLALDRLRATLTMTRAAGLPLESILRAARSGSRKDRARFSDAARLSGIWLERFQNFERQEGSEALSRLHSRALADLALVRESLGSRRAARLETRIGQLVEAVALEQPLAVSHHGDLWPGNIFVAEGSVEVIDLEGYRLGLPSEDIAYLFVHMGLYLAFRAESCLEQFRKSFLEGYGREASRSELELSSIAAALQLSSRRASEENFVRRLIADRYIRRELFS